MSVLKDLICYCEKAKGKFFLLSPFTTSENVIERKKASAIAGAFFYSKKVHPIPQNERLKSIKMAEKSSKINPRYANGSLRRKNRARLKAMGGECGICKGRLGPIHYNEPSNSQFPLSFVVDEIKPVSKWQKFGYSSAKAAAEDWNNLQPAHYICNNMKSNNENYDLSKPMAVRRRPSVVDGEW